MKNAKKIFVGLLLTAIFCVTTATYAASTVGVSVFLDNMFDQPKTSNITKRTDSMQTFEPFEVYKDRQALVALYTSDDEMTDGLWHALNKEDGVWDIETFSTQANRLPGSYYLKFKTTGIYIGGTGITGFWTYDL